MVRSGFVQCAIIIYIRELLITELDRLNLGHGKMNLFHIRL